MLLLAVAAIFLVHVLAPRTGLLLFIAWMPVACVVRIPRLWNLTADLRFTSISRRFLTARSAHSNSAGNRLRPLTRSRSPLPLPATCRPRKFTSRPSSRSCNVDRSENMRRIRSKNMRPELAVRSLVHRMGYRFRLHRNELHGKPDLVFG